MNKVIYSDSFIKDARKLLYKMTNENLDIIPFRKPFENMSVIRGNPADKLVVAIVEIPQDLKEKIGNKKICVVT